MSPQAERSAEQVGTCCAEGHGVLFLDNIVFAESVCTRLLSDVAIES